MVLDLKNDEKIYLAKLLKGTGNLKDFKLGEKIARSTNRIATRSAKAKGRGFQYDVCRLIAGIFNIDFDQNDDKCLIHSREMGLNGVDIILRGEVRDAFKYDVECKAQENIRLSEFISQAIKNSKESDRDWLLFIKNRSMDIPIVICDFRAFKKLYMKSDDYKEYINNKK